MSTEERFRRLIEKMPYPDAVQAWEASVATVERLERELVAARRDERQRLIEMIDAAAERAAPMTGSEERFRPNFMDAAAALALLLWLFENGDVDGADRDEISHVRSLIEQEWIVDEWAAVVRAAILNQDSGWIDWLSMRNLSPEARALAEKRP